MATVTSRSSYDPKCVVANQQLVRDYDRQYIGERGSVARPEAESALHEALTFPAPWLMAKC